MTEDQRKEATMALYEWITEAHGERSANEWLWAATCYPCDLPLDDQLEDGLRLASGEISFGALLGKVERQMEEAVDAYVAANETGPFQPGKEPSGWYD